MRGAAAEAAGIAAAGIIRPANVGRLIFRIQWPGRSRVVPLAADSIWFRISGSDPNSLPAVGEGLVARPEAGGTSTFTFNNLQPGFVNINAAAYPNRDGTGIIQGIATYPAGITGGKVTTVDIDLISAVTKITVSVSQSLAPGQTLQAEHTTLNSREEMVLVADKSIQWTSSDTSVATIDGAGMITAVAVGKAVITAHDKESGISGTATVQVSGPPASGNVFASVQNLQPSRFPFELREYTPSGDIVRAVPIPQPGDANIHTPPVISNHDGKVYALTGNRNVYLSVYDPITSVWSNRPLPGVSFGFPDSLAPMGCLGNYLFVITYRPPAPPGFTGGNTGTVVRYDLSTGEARLFGDKEYTAVSVGWDGNLYLLENTYGGYSRPSLIHVFDPVTLLEKRTLSYSVKLGAMAVNSAGLIYAVVSDDERILQLAPDGALLNSYLIQAGYVWPGNLQFDRNGRILIGGGLINITNESFDNRVIIPVEEGRTLASVTSTAAGQ